MDDVTFQRRLRAILGDPILSLTVLDPRTEEPYLLLCELFMECNENQRAHIRSGWPYGREWHVPVPGTTYDWRGGEMSERRLRASLIHDAIQPTVPDWRDVMVGFPVMYWAANQLISHLRHVQPHDESGRCTVGHELIWWESPTQ